MSGEFECFWCIHFQDIPDTSNDNGYCKKRAPISARDEDGEMVPTWPIVSAWNDYCGDFKLSVSKKEKYQ